MLTLLELIGGLSAVGSLVVMAMSVPLRSSFEFIAAAIVFLLACILVALCVIGVRIKEALQDMKWRQEGALKATP